MSTEVRAPPFPESISEGTVAAWHKKPGDQVRRDEPLVDIETEKITIEVVAPVDGTLEEILKAAGETITSGELIGRLKPGEVSPEATAPSGAPAAEAPAAPSQAPTPTEPEVQRPKRGAHSPAVRKLAAELGVDLDAVTGTGRDGRILRGDVQRAAEKAPAAEMKVQQSAMPQSPPVGTQGDALAISDDSERVERRVPMSRLRASIARRLVEAQHTAAMLTTFNEADMTEIIRLRQKYRDRFADSHDGVRLGFMSFFVRASVEALKRFPAVNASIDGTEIVYHGYYDIGVAVSTEAGLFVPVVRDADALGLAQIENQIVEYSNKARENKLTLEQLSGGTFTISNGGVFGSLLSTPILNPPQTAILGMHKIQERPMVIDAQIVARPMMYLALSYDHRLIDGREAVRFLVTIKDMVEDPARLLLEI